MRKCILWVSPLRAALTTAFISFVLSYPAIGILWLINQLAADPGRPNWLVLMGLPIFAGVCAALFAFLAATVYNLIAKLGAAVTFDVEQVVFRELNTSHAGAGPAVEPPQEEFHRF